MQTEFTCGIYKVRFNEIGGHKWFLQVNQHTLGIVECNGLLKFTDTPVYLSSNDLIEISVLLTNIKRQYKQLQTT
jgi:hypothetical protein